ncbi:FecCD family ABC transporter permease [Erwinia piriflorinigrans]|uniref:Ferrichrome transport system permease protein fhuB n=1 Tax=Erwinia piriflorinigrans CFBP 5888 TaxID=1161919 RepID=V5ZAK7_9GAMM|nr:iron ABC transporter permease [Erwinia piriflorinigrans]CCG88411.1 Ferrichrome transport system permease protein fhuB [Erwinia piriflorinigrans CFBP 5888]
MSHFRYFLIIIISLITLIILMLLSVVVGSVPLPISQVLSSLGLYHVPVPDMVCRIVFELRLPRSLLAALTGAGLAMVGALLQTTTRNELADPFLFGLSSGASAGAVAVITRYGDHLGSWGLPTSAFVGGIISSISVMLLFILQRAKGAEKLVISGLAVSFLFGSLTNYLVFSGDQRAASSVLFWSLGGLGLARWDNIGFALAAVVLLFALVALRWRWLDALLAGEQTAVSLGINLNLLRIEIFLGCALATSLLVSLTGVIGFVGLMVPHLARPLCGVRHRLLVPVVALFGAILMSGGDLLSRIFIAPQELPIGIITAGLGGFFVLGLLLKR